MMTERFAAFKIARNKGIVCRPRRTAFLTQTTGSSNLSSNLEDRIPYIEIR